MTGWNGYIDQSKSSLCLQTNQREPMVPVHTLLIDGTKEAGQEGGGEHHRLFIVWALKPKAI